MDLLQSLTTIPRLSAAEWPTLPAITQYLVMVRAAVLVMTLISALVGVLMAASDGYFHAGRLVALLIGLLAAHATNNLINDLVDSSQGLDTGDYLRRRYGVHVLEEGLVGRVQFAWIIAGTGAVAVAAGSWLVLDLGENTLWLMIAGAFFVVFYTWPLKHFALGELAVLLVWGPLMTAGSYYVMAGVVPAPVLLLSLAYGIGPTLVILGKHIDKLEQDRGKGVRSLPVALGERGSRYLSLALVALQWVMLGFVCTAWQDFWLIVTVLGVPPLLDLVRALWAPKPHQKPEQYPDAIWPLWFSAFAFRYTRDFGGLLVLALALRAVASW